MVRKQPRQNEEVGEPQEAFGAPPRELYPVTDARAIFVEMGKLSKQSEITAAALDRLTEKVSKVDDTVRSAYLVGKVLIVVFVPIMAALGWIISFLWPLRHKLAEIIFP